jgi:hypothetical protein
MMVMDVPDRRVLRGVVCMMKRSGPRTDPWGTPLQDRGMDVDLWKLWPLDKTKKYREVSVKPNH